MAYDPSRHNRRESSVVPRPKITWWHRTKEALFVIFLIFAVRLVMLESGMRFGHLPLVDDVLIGLRAGIAEVQEIIEFYF